MKMEEDKKRVHNVKGPSLVPPKIPTATGFKLKGHNFLMLKDIPFFGKDYEDAFKNIDQVSDITNYFNVLNVSRDVVLLRILPVTFTSNANFWL